MSTINTEPYVAPVVLTKRGPRGIRGPEIELRDNAGVLEWRVVEAEPGPWIAVIDLVQYASDSFGNSATLDVGTSVGTVAAGDHSHAHFTDDENPHGVTKDQIDLGNVDNTSDADKPVSGATQAALDGKAATDLFNVLQSDARTKVGTGTMAYRNVTVSTADPSGGVNGDVWFKV